MRFRAKKTFHSHELLSQYCRGLLYTIRPEDTLLSKMAAQWLDEGKIELVAEAGSGLSGTAEVKE